jgi:hypothetical protein
MPWGEILKAAAPILADVIAAIAGALKGEDDASALEALRPVCKTPEALRALDDALVASQHAKAAKVLGGGAVEPGRLPSTLPPPPKVPS